MPVAEQHDVRPKAFSTPTRSAAKLLEEMVAQQDFDGTSFTVLSQSQSSRGANSDLPPLPTDAIRYPEPLSPPHSNLKARLPGDTTAGMTFDIPHASRASQDSFSEEATPTGHKPKHSSKSLPRRVVEESYDRRHRHSSPSRESAATESHTGRHRYAGSHTRSTSDSISVIMLMSKERLARETARANEAERRALDAERQAADVMTLFKNTHEAKLMLERDLNKTREELGLYKIQLEAAQKEIFRAQEIVDRVERQRVNAEDELSRVKDKLRQLSQKVAVEHALEEGRRAGFEEGLKQGRVYQQSWNDTYEKMSKRSRRHSGRNDSDSGSEISSYTYPKEGSGSESPGSSRSRRARRNRSAKSPAPLPVPAPSEPATHPPESAVTPSIFPQVSTYNPLPRRDPQDQPSTSSNAPAPDVATYSTALPIRTLTTPLAVRVPSTQPPIPVPMPPHRAPESIKIKPSEDPLHPIPVYNTPSAFRESIVLPPEGYIPVMDAHSVISLPPPHELSIAVPPETPILPPKEENKPIPVPVPAPKAKATESRFRVVNGDRTVKGKEKEKESRLEAASQYGRPPSTAQPAALPPPRTYEASRAPQGAGGVPIISVPRPRIRQVNNPETKSSGHGDRWISPPPGNQMKDNGRSQGAGRDSRTHVERPRTTEPPPYPRPDSAAGGPSTARPGRRTREVVLTVPLGDPFDDPTTAHGHKAHPPRAATPANPAYGRPKFLHGSSEDSSSNDRRGSTATIEIDVQTPTTTHQSVQSNRTTVVDPVLLTPDAACPPITLPVTPNAQTHHDPHQHQHQQHAHGHSQSRPPSRPEHNGALGIFTATSDAAGSERTEGGFVPLSPIPGMENLHAYPPGFAPTIPRDHPTMTGGGSPNFTYSSPLVRPVA